MTKQNNVLFDVTLNAPDNLKPEQVRIVLDSKTRNYQEQYADQLHLSRNVPFNVNALTVADVLVVYFLQKPHIRSAEQPATIAMMAARQTYEQWANDIQQESWVMALLAHNEFQTDPTPYEDDDVAPGLEKPIKPTRNLLNPVERRLKQIYDLLGADAAFSVEVQNAINAAFAEVLTREGRDEIDPETGFQLSGTGGDTPKEAKPDDNSA